MLSSASELLVRNSDIFEDGKWALVNPTDSDIFSQLTRYNITGFHQFFDRYVDSKPYRNQVFGETLKKTEDTPFDGVVLYLPSAKAHLQMLLDNISHIVKPGGTIAIVGSNDAGIKSIGKLLKKRCGIAQKRDTARHCALWCSVNADPLNSFDLNDYITINEYCSGSTTWRVASLPGVFSHGSLDPGTELLLSHLPTMKGNRLLDFACGAGVIGAFIHQRYPSMKITFSDVNALALFACQRTMELNQIDGTVVASDGLKQINNKFDIVVSNPPFHTGKTTNYSITESFIQSVSSYLNPKGLIYLVANRFLPYPDIIDRFCHRLPDVAKSSKFTVYSAEKK